MYIHKEIISVVVLIILILGFAAIKFLIDFKRLNKDLKNLSRENLSAKDYFFFHQFEPFIYKLNSYSKIFNQQLSAKRLQILFYDKFFNSFPDPLFIIDQNNQIFQLNIMATKLVGKKAKFQNINSVLRIPGLGELIQKSTIKKKPQESTLTLSFHVETVYNVWISGPSNLGGTKLNFIRLYDYTDEKKVNDLKPPIFWKDKPNFVAQCKKWNDNKINTKLKELYSLEASFKSNNVLNKEIALKKFIVDICISANS